MFPNTLLLLAFIQTAVKAFTPLQSINGAVEIQVQLIFYTMPDDKLEDGSRCDFPFSSETCDLAFSFCADPYDEPNPTPISICSGTVYRTGQLTTNVDHEFFQPNTPYGTWFNPTIYTYNYGWKGSWFKARVFDQDGSAQQLIDEFIFPINSTILNAKQSSYSFSEYNGTRLSNPTSFSIKVEFACMFGMASDGVNCAPYRSTSTTTALSTATLSQVLESNNAFYVLGKLPTDYESTLATNIRNIIIDSGVPLVTNIVDFAVVTPVVSVTFAYYTLVGSDAEVTKVSFTVSVNGRFVSSVSIDHAFATFSSTTVRRMLSENMGASLNIITQSDVQIEVEKPWYQQYWYVILVVGLVIALLSLGLTILACLLYQYYRRRKVANEFWEKKYHRSVPTVYQAHSRANSNQRLWIPAITDPTLRLDPPVPKQRNLQKPDDPTEKYVYSKPIASRWSNPQNREDDIYRIPVPDYDPPQQQDRSVSEERETAPITNNQPPKESTMDSQLRRVFQVEGLGPQRSSRRSMDSADILY